jgi:phenylpropionate dioxygenase-like ring-hydroxylating dioxygenase large terminal subunit
LIERQGVLWVSLAVEPVAPPPDIALHGDPAYRCFELELVLPGSHDFWLDNFVDLSHVPFVHRRTFGGRYPAVETWPVERRQDELGLSARMVARYHYGLLTRLLHGSIGPYAENVRVDVTLPALIATTIDLGGGRRQALLFLLTPEDAEHTRLLITVRRNFMKWLPFADALGRTFTRWVVAEDARIAERAFGPPIAAGPGQPSCAADAPGVELARLVRLWREREQEQSLARAAG